MTLNIMSHMTQNPSDLTLVGTPRNTWTTVLQVGGARGFRRRLLEMGFVPGTDVKIVGRAPMGDPLELEVGGGRVSIRKAQAAAILVSAKA
jgi:ferrous iron transport protein A